MKIFKKKLAEYVADNPNYRWPGDYKVKYKGQWIIAHWRQYKSNHGSWYWQLANDEIFICDNVFDKIIEK